MEDKLRFWNNYGKIFLPVVLFLFIFVFSVSLSVKSSSRSGEACAADGRAVCSTTSTTTIPPYAARAVDFARSQIGKPYAWGTPSRSWQNTKSPASGGASSYDCSGLVGWAYYWASGGSVYLSGQTEYDFFHPAGKGSMGFEVIRGTNAEIKSKAKLGDLIFWEQTDSGRYTIHHVAIYSGNGKYIDAPYTGANVSEKSWSRCCAAGLLRLKN